MPVPVAGGGSIPGIDGLRAVAVFLVMVFHSRALGAGFGGAAGVEVFFVISGFLITGLLTAEYRLRGRIDIIRFHLRRLARLYPVLLVFLAVVGVVSPWLDKRFDISAETLLAGVYLYNFADEWVGRELLLRHLWTLGVEMQFYLLWPFVLLALLKVQQRGLVPALAAIVALSLVLRFTLASEILPARWIPGLHFPPFLLGGLLAIVQFNSRRPLDVFNWPALAAILAVAFLPKNISSLPANAALTMVDGATATLILACIKGGRVLQLLAHWIPARLGQWSYGIYVWHYLIVRELRNDFSGLPSLLIGLACTLPVAAISYHFLEVPMRRYLQLRIDKWRLDSK